MKPQAKCALIGIALTILLLVTLIQLDRISDGTTVSMMVIIALIILTALYSFVMGINAAPITPRTKIDTVHHYDTRAVEQDMADKTAQEIKRAIDRSIK